MRMRDNLSLVPQPADPSFASQAVKSLGFVKGTGDTGTMLQGVG